MNSFQLFLLLFTLFTVNDQINPNPDFYVESGTCKCPDASFGDSGTVMIDGQQKTFTKRSRADLDALISADDQDPQIALTCTTGISDMNGLFITKQNFNQNINSWDVSNVTDMSNMFYLTGSFDQPLNKWDVSNVTNMSSMFFFANEFDQDLYSWDVSNVTDMESMLAFNSFNKDISTWCVEQIPSAPLNFSVDSDLQSNNAPNWGEDCTVTTWTSSNTWDQGVPDANDTAVIDADIDINNSFLFRNIEVNPNKTVNIYGELKVLDNITNNGNIIFKSNSSNTGQLDEFYGTISGSGDITVERYIPVKTEGTRAFRFLTSSLDSHEPIFDNWQESGNSPDGLGTHITGNNNGTNGVDDTQTGSPSMYTFDNQNTNGGGQDDDWGAVTNTKVNHLVAGQAYRIFIRGDRNYDLNSYPADAPNSNVTLRAKGSLITGSKTYNLNPHQDEYSLIGNPYQAKVDMSLVLSNNINTDYYYVWDPNINGDNGKGGYVTVDIGNNTSTGTSSANKFLMPGQSIFVQTSSNGAADVTFSETDKAVNEATTTVFSDDDLFTLDLLLYNDQSYNNGGAEADALTINFQTGGNNAIDQMDADKIGNPGENLARVNGNSYLSIENRALPVDDESLELFSDGLGATNYIFLADLTNLPSDVSPYLIDDHTGDQTLLSEGENQISFSVDPSSPGSIATDRFSIEFEVETFGVEDNETADNFKVYPNPVKNEQINIQAPNMSGEVSISLSNMLGQRVIITKGELSGNGEMTLNIGDQQSGVYFIELSQNGQTAKERLIIK